MEQISPHRQPEGEKDPFCEGRTTQVDPSTNSSHMELAVTEPR